MIVPFDFLKIVMYPFIAFKAANFFLFFLLKNIFIFLFRSSQKKLQPQDPHNPIAKWVPYDKVADLLTHPKDKEFYLKTLKLWINI